MNKPAENRRAKGLTLEGFWQQLRDKTEQKNGGTNVINARDLPKDLHDFPEDSRDMTKPHEDWETRFDAWLNRL